MTTSEVMDKIKENWENYVKQNFAMPNLPLKCPLTYEEIQNIVLPILREFGEALREEDAKLVLTYCSAFRKKTGTNPYPIEISQRIHTVKIE